MTFASRCRSLPRFPLASTLRAALLASACPAETRTERAIKLG